MAFEYIAGDVSLDLVNTVDWWLADGRRVELLESFSDFLEWAAGAGILSPARKRTLAALARRRRREANATLEQAHELREAIARAAISAAGDGKIAPADLKIINGVLRRGESSRVLGQVDGQPAWTWQPLKPSLEEPLWVAAHAAADLLTSENRTRIGRCNDEDCGWFFVDTSRNRSRRWCSMASCGSRQKARAYYRRRKRSGAGV